MSQLEPKSHRLDEIFLAAKSHPIYQNDLQKVASYSQSPLMNRSKYFQRMTECFDKPGFLDGMYISPSGGSSKGKASFVATDIKENEYQRALFSMHLQKNNILSKGKIAINLMPCALMYRASEIFTEFCSRAEVTVLPVNEHAPDPMVCRMAELFHADTIIGMPSRLVEFAEYVQNNQIQVHFEHLIFAGEALSKERRAYLEKILNIRRFTGIFGSAESGIWAFQPDFLPLNSYVIVQELMYVEIVSADENGYGKIVLTNLVRVKNPLLRYDTGDTGRLRKMIFDGREVYVLDLLQRAGVSFEIGESRFTFKDTIAGCPNYQVRLSIDPEKLLEKASIYLAPDVFPDAEEKREIVESLKTLLQERDNSFISEVHFVKLDALIKSPTSQKPIRLLDSRVPQPR